MNKLATILTASVALTALAADAKLTPTELQQGRLYLEQTRDLAIGATKGLSEAQWNFKPAPDRWSIAEIVEHMVLTQNFALGPIRAQLAQAPKAQERDAKQVDSLLLAKFPDRLQKFNAPDVLKPTGRWTPAESLERLLGNTTKLEEYLESTPDLRQHTIEGAPLKALSQGKYDQMDGYQWILATAAHTERHVKQILEVKADPNFPMK